MGALRLTLFFFWPSSATQSLIASPATAACASLTPLPRYERKVRMLVPLLLFILTCRLTLASALTCRPLRICGAPRCRRRWCWSSLRISCSCASPARANCTSPPCALPPTLPATRPVRLGSTLARPRTREECVEILAASERYERLYRPYCDLLVTNNDLTTAVGDLVSFVQKVGASELRPLATADEAGLGPGRAGEGMA